jgi:hypothetical protein
MKRSECPDGMCLHRYQLCFRKRATTRIDQCANLSTSSLDVRLWGRLQFFALNAVQSPKNPSVSGVDSESQAGVNVSKGPQSLPVVKKRHLRTSPWSGQAANESASIAIAYCLPLRGSVRPIRWMPRLSGRTRLSLES